MLFKPLLNVIVWYSISDNFDVQSKFMIYVIRNTFIININRF
jgi:hypothetical protein